PVRHIALKPSATAASIMACAAAPAASVCSITGIFTAGLHSAPTTTINGARSAFPRSRSSASAESSGRTRRACSANSFPSRSRALASSRSVLEIGSGTGQHAVHFAAALPHLSWQPTELAGQLAPLAERIRLEGTPNLRAPIALDVHEHPWPVAPVDAVFSANTLHIMGWSAVRDFFRGVGEALGRPGVLCVYGPFRYHGEHTSQSNADFDRWLKAREPAT